MKTTLSDGTPVVFTEGAWEAIGAMLENAAREDQEAEQREHAPPCQHDEMVPNNEPGFAWRCAVCGYVYGKNYEN